MKNIDPRLQKNINSILSLRNYLKDVSMKPSAAKDVDKLKEALKSQNGLSKYANSEQGISSSSVNTLKRVSNAYVDGGWDKLDELRRLALASINEDSKKKLVHKNTKADLQQKLMDVENSLDLYRKYNFVLLQAVTESMKEIQIISECENLNFRARKAKEALSKLRALVSLNVTNTESLDVKNEK